MGFGVVPLLDAVFRRMFRSAGLRPGSATVNAEDETVIHYWAHPSLLRPPSDSEQRPAPPPVVVLIHGFGPDPTWQWAAQAGPLSRHFRLVVPTLLFFGASATRAPARSDAAQAAALAALLAGHGQHLPGLGAGRTVHVVGTSYGGLVAYHLARELERQGAGGGGVRVGKVVLCDSDACKGAEDDRALAARCGVAEVAEVLAPADTRALRRLMAVCAHRPVKYVPECLLRDMLRKYFADKREEKIALIRGIATGEGFELPPLPQVNVDVKYVINIKNSLRYAIQEMRRQSTLLRSVKNICSSIPEADGDKIGKVGCHLDHVCKMLEKTSIVCEEDLNNKFPSWDFDGYPSDVDDHPSDVEDLENGYISEDPEIWEMVWLDQKYEENKESQTLYEHCKAMGYNFEEIYDRTM